MLLGTPAMMVCVFDLFMFPFPRNRPSLDLTAKTGPSTHLQTSLQDAVRTPRPGPPGPFSFVLRSKHPSFRAPGPSSPVGSNHPFLAVAPLSARSRSSAPSRTRGAPNWWSLPKAGGPEELCGGRQSFGVGILLWSAYPEKGTSTCKTLVHSGALRQNVGNGLLGTMDFGEDMLEATFCFRG